MEGIEWFYLILIIFGGTAISHFFFEGYYWWRTLISYVSAKYIKKRSFVLDPTSVSGFCWFNDIDQMITHMNNARYFREIDFARVDFYMRTRIWETIAENGGSIVISSINLRFRRFIQIFGRFEVTTKVVYWDDKSIFLEHRFICKKFVHAIFLCRMRVSNCSAEEIMKILLKEDSPSKMENGMANSVKPEMPLEVLKFLELNEASSANLKNNC